MSYKKLEERRAKPWPRYRLAEWSHRFMAWQDQPGLLYDKAQAEDKARARSHEIVVRKVRVQELAEGGGVQVVAVFVGGYRQ